jgi:tetratricopeptide (TPR) repeat protein
MNNKFLYSEEVDNYLDGNITESEKAGFEHDLKKNSKLKAELALEKDCRTAISDTGMLDFRSKLIDAQKRYNEINSNRGRLVAFTRKYWAAAAVILLLLVSGLVYFIQPGQYTNERLFKMYYKTEEAVGISRSGNGNIVEAIIKYHEKDYVTALTLFDDILKADPANFAIRYYSGISYIETGNFDNAVKMLESVIEQNDNLYVEYAQWYCSLAYLAKGDKVSAEAGFKAIASDSNHYYKDQASSILVKMEQGADSKNFLKKVLFFILPF